ncbi:MAG TPA: NnrS family protein [Candidatus Obscuribacterales bacterium]
MSTVPAAFAREQVLIHLLMAFIATGLIFMLLPGTLVGVWNLFTISSEHAADSASLAWVQAHGHAQLFGWIGSFILGIGFYSTPNVRRVSTFGFRQGWLCWGLWTAGVALRWIADMYSWQWRVLLPVSSLMELLAVTLFLIQSARGHKLALIVKRKIEPWAVLVLGGTAGLALTVGFNVGECLYLTAAASTPVFPRDVASRLLVLATWGFVVPIVWGFTAHWMLVFLGLRPTNQALLLSGFWTCVGGVAFSLAGWFLPGATLILLGSFLAVVALRLFEPAEKPAKTAGVHPSFPAFVRLAYGWLIVAAFLSLWAAMAHGAAGIAGAGRHALTVGFFSTMVFSVAPRILPAFMSRKQLFSSKLMLVSLSALTAGCLVRVVSQIVAYQGYADWAWTVLPASATLELLAFLAFGINMLGTMLQPPMLPRLQ